MEQDIVKYSKIIKLNPNDDTAYYNRGVIKRQLGDLKGAIEDYNQALRINPNLAIQDFDHAKKLGYKPTNTVITQR